MRIANARRWATIGVTTAMLGMGLLSAPASAQANQELGDSGWSWGWSAEERVRFHREDNKAFGGTMPQNNTFWLNRFRVFGDLENTEDGIRVHAELIDARITGNERPPLGIDRNDLDARNLWVEFDTSDDTSVRLGRTDLQYGAQRLVSPLDWANTRRTFEGVLVKQKFDGGQYDAFITKPVVLDRHNSDHDDDSRYFSGIYSTWDLGDDGDKLDAYALALNEETSKITSGTGRVGKLDIYTFGLRHFGKGDSGFEWDAEVAKQTGRSAGDRVSAEMAGVKLGYRATEVELEPRFGIDFDYASGDDNPTDSSVGSFNQLFPLGHAYLGKIDLVARSNILDVQPNVTLKLGERTTFKVEYHMFTLDEKKDALRNAGGGVVVRDPTGASGDDVGDEVDLMLVHKPEDWLLADHILLGYSQFMPGSFITSQRGQGRVNFYYAQLTKRF